VLHCVSGMKVFQVGVAEREHSGIEAEKEGSKKWRGVCPEEERIDCKRESDKDVSEKVAYQVRPHSTRRTCPKRVPREEASHGIAPKDTQDSGEARSRTHGNFWEGSKAGLLLPCALSIRRRERHTSTEESLDEAANSGRVDVEGMTGEKESGCETMCAELLGDGVD
jgi:hypothetical protein